MDIISVFETDGAGSIPAGPAKQYGYSIMDNTAGFYPANMGSIPVSRANQWCS
jgi:hypothetical protein